MDSGCQKPSIGFTPFITGQSVSQQLSAPEVNFELTTTNVVGGTRRILASWTPELTQDLQAFVGFNAEDELVAILDQQIHAQREITKIKEHKVRVKRGKYRDRRLYIKEIENFCSVVINN